MSDNKELYQRLRPLALAARARDRRAFRRAWEKLSRDDIDTIDVEWRFTAVHGQPLSAFFDKVLAESEPVTAGVRQSS